MNKTIEAYRKRRMDRLRSRGAHHDDIDWITVENGEHVPIENGKSVGGWSKGRDFSRAKSTKSVPKGTESPIRRASRELRKAKSVKDKTEREKAVKDALAKMQYGEQIHLIIGNRIISYQKNSHPDIEPYYQGWFCSGGIPEYSPEPVSHAFSDHRYMNSEYLSHWVATHRCYGSLAAAKKELSKTFPSKTSAGRLAEVTSMVHMRAPTRWYKDKSPERDSERVYRELKADKTIQNEEYGTQTFAVYKKSISKSKELNDFVEKLHPDYELHKAFEKMGVKGYVFEYRSADMPITRDSKGNLYVTIQYKESHGRGRKATYREEKYKIDAYANKKNYVNSNGDLVSSEIEPHEIRYKLTPVAKEKAT